MERNLTSGQADNPPEGTDDPERTVRPETPRRTDGSSSDRSTFDSADYTSVGEAVVDAVATVSAIDPLEMDPLYFHIDLDALERIVGPKLNGQRRRGRVTVEFQVEDRVIAVNSDGLVCVSEVPE